MTALLHWLHGKPRPKPKRTLKQAMNHAYYMRNRDRFTAYARARYYEKKAAA